MQKSGSIARFLLTTAMFTGKVCPSDLAIRPDQSRRARGFEGLRVACLRVGPPSEEGRMKSRVVGLLGLVLMAALARRANAQTAKA